MTLTFFVAGLSPCLACAPSVGAAVTIRASRRAFRDIGTPERLIAIGGAGTDLIMWGERPRFGNDLYVYSTHSAHPEIPMIGHGPSRACLCVLLAITTATAGAQKPRARALGIPFDGAMADVWWDRVPCAPV